MNPFYNVVKSPTYKSLRSALDYQQNGKLKCLHVLLTNCFPTEAVKFQGHLKKISKSVCGRYICKLFLFMDFHDCFDVVDLMGALSLNSVLLKWLQGKPCCTLSNLMLVNNAQVWFVLGTAFLSLELALLSSNLDRSKATSLSFQFPSIIITAYYNLKMWSNHPISSSWDCLYSEVYVLTS